MDLIGTQLLEKRQGEQMTVKELIKKLRTFDPDTTVVVGGFDEEGYADIDRIEMVLAATRKGQIDIFGGYKKASTEEIFVKDLLLIDHS